MYPVSNDFTMYEGGKPGAARNRAHVGRQTFLHREYGAYLLSGKKAGRRGLQDAAFFGGGYRDGRRRKGHLRRAAQTRAHTGGHWQALL